MHQRNASPNWGPILHSSAEVGQPAAFPRQQGSSNSLLAWLLCPLVLSHALPASPCGVSGRLAGSERREILPCQVFRAGEFKGFLEQIQRFVDFSGIDMDFVSILVSLKAIRFSQGDQHTSYQCKNMERYWSLVPIPIPSPSSFQFGWVCSKEGHTKNCNFHWEKID